MDATSDVELQRVERALSRAARGVLRAAARNDRGKSKDNKQVRNLAAPIERAEIEESAQIIADACRLAFQHYKVLLGRGVPRELARSVLPVATYSHMSCSVNLLNLLHFLQLRSAADAQYEIRVYALAMRDLVREVVPVCIEAWEANP
jgi:thymidylate synthase (FAD)